MGSHLRTQYLLQAPGKIFSIFLFSDNFRYNNIDNFYYLLFLVVFKISIISSGRVYFCWVYVSGICEVAFKNVYVCGIFNIILWNGDSLMSRWHTIICKNDFFLCGIKMEWKGISQFTVIKAQANYYPPNSETSLMLSAKCNNDYIIRFYICIVIWNFWSVRGLLSLIQFLESVTSSVYSEYLPFLSANNFRH